MPGKSAILSIKILTDASQAQKGLDQASGAVGKMKAGLAKATVPAGIALAAVVAFGKGAVDAASRTQQAMGAVDSVFGKSAGQIKAWSDQSAKSVGLSKAEYGEMASVIGAQLKNMGVPMDMVAGKTNDLVKMGADLAATYGGTTADAVQALGSALRGETDPIERYGISIKQADIAARQAKDGTAKLTGAAGKQAKTTALLAMVTEQAGGAVGQFARESDSAAGSAQIAEAQYADMKSTMGEALLPVVSGLATMLGKLAGVMKEHSTTVQIVVVAIAAMAAAVIVLNAAMTVYTAVTTLAGSATLAAWAAALGPILLVIAAVALVIGIVVLLWKRCETFRTIVLAVWNAVRAGAVAAFNGIKSAALAVINWIKANWKILLVAMTGPLGAAVVLIVNNWARIKAAAKAAIDWIKSAWSTMWGALKSAASTAGSVLSAPFDALKRSVESVIDKVGDLIGWLKKIKVPSIHIPGVGGSSRSVAPTVAPTGVAALGARAGVGVTATGRGTTAGATIVIQGAVDPESTARQVRRLLDRHDGRVGLTGVLRTA